MLDGVTVTKKNRVCTFQKFKRRGKGVVEGL